MFVTYRPEGSEPEVYEFRPGRVRSMQAAMIEKRFAKLIGEKSATWDQFKIAVLQGSASARRVLLWHLQSLAHPTLRIEDLPDFYEEELLVEHSKSELEEMRESLEKAPGISEGDLTIMLGKLDVEIMTAREGGGGKAPSATSSDATG
jgi:hypothetical protein